MVWTKKTNDFCEESFPVKNWVPSLQPRSWTIAGGSQCPGLKKNKRSRLPPRKFHIWKKVSGKSTFFSSWKVCPEVPPKKGKPLKGRCFPSTHPFFQRRNLQAKNSLQLCCRWDRFLQIWNVDGHSEALNSSQIFCKSISTSTRSQHLPPQKTSSIESPSSSKN